MPEVTDEEKSEKILLETGLRPLVEGLGLEFVDLDWRSEPSGWVLRLYVDRPGSKVTLGDCEEASRKVENYLDQSELIHRRYSLEVSSPGLNRPLKRPEDFARFCGQRVHLELREPLAGSNQRVFQAWINEADDHGIKFESQGRLWSVSYEAIAKAHLDPEITF